MISLEEGSASYESMTCAGKDKMRDDGGFLDIVFQQSEEHWPAINSVSLQVFTYPILFQERDIAVSAIYP